MRPRKLIFGSMAVLASFTPEAALATDIVWGTNLGAGGPWVWNTGANWTGGTAPVTSSDRGDLRKDWTVAPVINLSAPTTVNGILFEDAGASGDVAGTIANGGTSGNILTLAGTAPSVEVIGSLTISAAVAGNTNWSKTGAGTLNLSNLSNTFSGGVSATAGTLQLGFITNTQTYAFTGNALSLNAATLFMDGNSGGTYVHTYNFASLAAPISVTDSTLSFKSTNATTKAFNAALSFSGTNSINYTGSNYTHHLNLNRAITGSGTLNFNFTNTGGFAGRNVNLASGQTNNFTGTVVLNTAAGTANWNLASALGATAYEIRNSWVLNNNVAGGLNSANSISLFNSSSTLNLTTNSWSNTNGVLTLTNGFVNLGTKTLAIKDITQTAGTLNLNLSGATNGSVALGGNYSRTGGGITANFTARPTLSTYDLVTYAGTLTGTPAITTTGIHPDSRLVVATNLGDGSNDKITLGFSTPLANLKWLGNDGSNPNNFDLKTTANFDHGGSADQFYVWDNVLFDDDASSFSPTIIGSLAAGNLTFDHNTNHYTLGGAGGISGDASLTKSGTGTLTITAANTHTGSNTLANGRIRVGNAAAFGTGSLVLNGGALSSDGATARTLTNALTLGGDVTLGDATDTGALTLSGAAALTGSRTLTAASAVTMSGIISGNGFTLSKSGSAALTLSGVNTFNGNVTVNAGKLVLGVAEGLGAAGSKTITVGSTGQLDFNGISPGTSRTYNYRISGDGGGTGALTNSSATGIASNAGIQNLELLGNSTIGGTGRFDIARVGSTSGTINGNGFTLTKTGANQIDLRGAASNLPSIIVNGGTLGAEDSDLAFGGATGNVTVNNTGTLSTYGVRSISTPVTLNGGSMLGNLGGGAGTWTGLITLGGNATIAPAGQTINLNNIISGVGYGITVPSNGGTVNLNAANTFTGGLAVGGALDATTATNVVLGAAGSLSVAASKEIVVGATNSGTAAQTFNVDGNVANSGSLRVIRMGVVNVRSGATWGQSGNMSLGGVGGYSAALNVNANGAYSYSGTSTIKLNGSPGNSGQANLGVAGTGVFTTSAGFEQTTTPTTGYGRVTLSGGGTLKLSSDISALTTQVQFALGTGGGVIDTNGYNTTLSGAATLGSGAALAAGITGAGGLTKVGDGTLTLSGANSYTGDTLVSAGTLLVTGQLGATNVTVANDATIAGNGSIGGSLTLGATAKLLFSTTDTLEVNGPTVTFGSGFSMSNIVGLSSSVADGTYTLIDGLADVDLTGVSHVGWENAYVLGPNKYAFFQQGSLQVVVIPELRAALLGGIGTLLLLRRRREI